LAVFDEGLELPPPGLIVLVTLVRQTVQLDEDVAILTSRAVVSEETHALQAGGTPVSLHRLGVSAYEVLGGERTVAV
jgi:hypothetical protein